MSSVSTKVLKKRGRPAKYASNDEKKEANAKRRRVQRKTASAVEREARFDQHYLLDQAQAVSLLPVSDGSTGDAAATAQTRLAELRSTERDELGEFLPPLSPLSSPLLGPKSMELGDASGSIDLRVSRTAFLPTAANEQARIQPHLADQTVHATPSVIFEPSMAASGPSTPIFDSETFAGARELEETPQGNAITVEEGVGASISEDGDAVAAGVHLNDKAEDVSRLAGRMVDQLIQHRGCCEHCHRHSRDEHAQLHSSHVGLQEYLDGTGEAVDYPDILGLETIATREANLAAQTSGGKRRTYCGIDEKDARSAPVHICLEAEDRRTAVAEVTFDIDSVIGIPSSLAIAKQGIRWNPTQMPISDLRSGLHLNTRPVHYVDRHGHAHTVRKPIHQLPHYSFGRLIGFDDISLYLLFPHLFREEQQSSRLLDDDFRIWMDQILLPAIYQHHGSSLVQHYPSSYDHSRYNSTARGVEARSQRTDARPREQLLSHFLPPDSLHRIWQTILRTVQTPGLRQFRDVLILINGKNLKTLTKGLTWEEMTSRFQNCWTDSIAEAYITPEFYFDVGKEVCPVQKSRVARTRVENEAGEDGIQREGEAPAETLLWKRCCLETFGNWIQGYHGQAADGHQTTFYPFSMLHDSGSMTIETHQSSKSRAVGLLYSQFYASIKEVFAAGNVYPFTNVAIETLALDPRLRKTWQHVGAGLSHNPVALVRAYLYTKLRCHHAIRGSMRKSFGAMLYIYHGNRAELAALEHQ
ncbi:hypothetical protein B0J12DRAFT_733727 [Macrophomina phaseolina]|uniref:Uncharacterized protein n=1 Tax=Macrophomina phaseolina TaxID=35725 RepID=A0ABQ8FQU8_9PEZI|nr:hypothetical protein B0J12DRAFT_733727 [Macrophomina phaseolina]